MATKLKSALEKIHWPLLVKSVLLTLFWWFSPAWAFLLCALYFYFSPYFQPWKVMCSFLIFLALAFLIPPLSGAFFYATGVAIGIVYYLILGVKDLLLINRQFAYQTLRLILITGVLLLFFWWGQSSSLQFVWRLFALFVALFVLHYEYFSFVLEKRSGNAFSAALTAFLLFQIAWVLAWLPMGFLNATAVELLALFMLNDFVLHHAKGNLSRKIVLANFTVFIFALLAIFLVSDWSVN